MNKSAIKAFLTSRVNRLVLRNAIYNTAYAGLDHEEVKAFRSKKTVLRISASKLSGKLINNKERTLLILDVNGVNVTQYVKACLIG
jgi:hypothetical protein